MTRKTPKTRKRSVDSHEINYELPRDPLTGERKRKYETVKGTITDARRVLREREYERDRGVYTRSGRTTFGEFTRQFIEDYAIGNLSPETVTRYQHMLNTHILPSLGHVRLSDLSAAHLQAYETMKMKNGRVDGKGGLSAHTVAHHHVLIRRIFESARKLGYVAVNPCDLVDKPRFSRKELTVLDADGVRKFLDVARGTPYFALFHFLLHSAGRRGEALAIKWRDIDLLTGFVKIQRAMIRQLDGSIDFKEPKTEGGRRLIKLPTSALLVLREHYQEQEARWAMMEMQLKERDFVFTDIEGYPLKRDAVSAAWRRVAKKAGFPGLRLHDARHTVATILMEGDTHPFIVKEMLGHKSIKTTIDTYTHVVPGLLEKAAQSLDAALGGSQADSVKKILEKEEINNASWQNVGKTEKSAGA